MSGSADNAPTGTAGIEIDTGTRELLCEIRDRVAIITLNRPEARNALSDQLSPALRRTIALCADHPDVGAVLLTGAGTTFCAGGDVKGMGANQSAAKQAMSDDERIADLKERQRLLTGALYHLRKPTICALPGAAAGAGLAIAMACDIRFGAQSAFISTGYARIGLSGDYGIAWLLTRLIGTSRARELMFTGERVNAARCAELGLFNRIIPDDQLMLEAFEFTRKLAHGPGLALHAIKDNLDDALDVDFDTARDREAERLIRGMQTQDHREAVRAFVEKREPKFTGQ